MRVLTFTMPAALLLLTFIACKNLEKKATSERHTKDLLLDKQIAKTEDEKIFSAKADSTATIDAGTTDPQNETKDPAGKPQTPSPANIHLTPAPNPDWDKKIVKTANIRLEVKKYKSFYENLRRTVKESGGYIAQEQQSQSLYKIENTVTIKVPVSQFDETIGKLASDSDRVEEKKISSEDVTMEVVDTKSRMETKKEVRQRYLDLLKQARSMKDILTVQNEINDIQEQIEGASGRIAYLGHAAAFSTINLNFYQVLDASAQTSPEPTFFHRLKEALVSGWDWLSSALVGMIALWPLWLAGTLAAIGFKKWRSPSRSKPIAS